jgi:hypothetical protein
VGEGESRDKVENGCESFLRTNCEMERMERMEGNGFIGSVFGQERLPGILGDCVAPPFLYVCCKHLFLDISSWL